MQREVNVVEIKESLNILVSISIILSSAVQLLYQFKSIFSSYNGIFIVKH